MRDLTKEELAQVRDACESIWKGVNASCMIEGEGFIRSKLGHHPETRMTREEVYRFAVCMGIIKDGSS